VMERARDGKGAEVESKEGEGYVRREGEMEFRGVRVIGFREINAPCSR